MLGRYARLELSSLRNVGLAPLHVTFLFFRDAAIVESGRVFGIELDRLVVVGDSTIEFALGAICVAAVVEGE